MSPTIRLGLSQGHLQLTDVPPLPSADSTAAIAASFARIWRAQLASGSPSLLWAFWRLLGPAYLWLGALKFASDLTVFIGPVLLNFLVTFLTSQTQAQPEPAWHGILYAVLLLVGVIVSSVLGTQYTFRSRRVSMRVRSALVSQVYRKSLSISGMAKRHFSSGRVTNVMSVDTERVMDVATSFHDFWSLPVQIAVALVLLYAQVGLALLAGLSVVLLLIPLNALLTKRIAAVSRRMMGFKDRRVALTNELLHHIRSVKLMALEPRFERRILAIRRREMGMLRTRKYLDALCVYFWATTPILVSLATFSLYAGMGNALTAANVFTSLALFNTLIRPLNSFPWVINGLVEGRVSALRVFDFLCADDREERAATGDDADLEEDVTVDLRGSFAYQRLERNSGAKWPKTAMGSAADVNGTAHATPVREPKRGKRLATGSSHSPPVLQTPSTNGHQHQNGSTVVKLSAAPAYVFHLEDVALRIRAGEFVGICGPVGSGKSSLLLAMLGELWGMRKAQLTPRAFVRGRVAYVAQEAWIQNATLRDNVLFGAPYEPDRYHRVLDAVALLPDLLQLPAGDLTEIGEGGINISGGQKVRVSIARAAYADCDVYLLDDILSAVDVHVGWHLITRLVHGLLAHKTVVLVTHHTHFLREADHIVQLKHGRIAHAFVSEDTKEQRALNRADFRSPAPLDVTAELGPVEGVGHGEEEPQSIAAQVMAKEVQREEEERLARLTVDESRQRGAIRRRVLSVYLAQIGPAARRAHRAQHGPHAGVAQLQRLLPRPVGGRRLVHHQHLLFLLLRPSYSLLPRPSAPLLPPCHLPPFHPHPLTATAGGGSDSYSHLRVLAFIALFNSLAALFRAFIFAYGGLVAARHLFDALLTRVLYARVAFFDENPVGRILNRFSTDLYAIDENIPFQGNIFLAQTFLLMGALVIIAITTPLFLALVPPLGLMYLHMQRRYRATSRELRRLDSVTRSPIYSNFSETLSGVYTVRAFRATDRFLDAFAVLLDTNQRVFYLALSASQWLNIRLQVIGVVIIAFLCGTAIGLAVGQGEVPGAVLNVSLVGLAIAYALPLTDTLNNLIGSFTDTEKEIVSVERAIEYLDVRTELDPASDDDNENGSLSPSASANTPRTLKRKAARASHEEALLPSRRDAPSKTVVVAAVTASWPSKGAVVFDDVSLVYRRGLLPALSHVSFTIDAGRARGRCGAHRRGQEQPAAGVAADAARHWRPRARGRRRRCGRVAARAAAAVVRDPAEPGAVHGDGALQRGRVRRVRRRRSVGRARAVPDARQGALAQEGPPRARGRVRRPLLRGTAAAALLRPRTAAARAHRAAGRGERVVGWGQRRAHPEADGGAEGLHGHHHSASDSYRL